MSKRFQNAQAAQNGACNPRAIAQGLVDAIDECRAEGTDPSLDPSVFLILHQLTWILTGHDFALDEGMGGKWGMATRSINAQLLVSELESK